MCSIYNIYIYIYILLSTCYIPSTYYVNTISSDGRFKMKKSNQYFTNS